MQEIWKGGHTYGVWSAGNGLWTEHLLAVRRRILMGLKKGFCKTADKIRGKIGIARLCDQGFQERKARCFHGGKKAEPFLFLRMEKLQPALQLGKGDGEAFTELLHGREAQEILRQDAEKEEQAVAGVWDDEVREDGMGMSAGTDQAQDAEAVTDGGTVYEINQGAAIVGVDAAGSLCPTTGAGLKFRVEPIHERFKQNF